MMNKFKPFLIGSLTGCALMFVSLQFHMIRSEDGFRMVPRTPQPSLGLFWVDIRGWTAEEFADRPELVRALAAHGSTDLVASSVTDSLLNDVSEGASPLDQLRESMNDDSPARGLQIPATIPVRDTEDANEFRDLLMRGFDQDARKLESKRVAIADDFKAPDDQRVVRDLPAIGAIFGEDQSTPSTPADDSGKQLDPFRASGTSMFSEQSDSAQRPFTATEESDLITEMLFGGQDEHSVITSERSSGWKDTVSKSTDRIMGDVRSEVADRAEWMADDFRGQFRRAQQQAFDQTLETVEDHSARKLKESLPEPMSQFLNSPSTPSSTGAGSLPPELKALQNGFDPFLK